MTYFLLFNAAGQIYIEIMKIKPHEEPLSHRGIRNREIVWCFIFYEKLSWIFEEIFWTSCHETCAHCFWCGSEGWSRNWLFPTPLHQAWNLPRLVLSDRTYHHICKKVCSKKNYQSQWLSQLFDGDEWPEESEQCHVVSFSCLKKFWWQTIFSLSSENEARVLVPHALKHLMEYALWMNIRLRSCIIWW